MIKRIVFLLLMFIVNTCSVYARYRWILQRQTHKTAESSPVS
jgi:hypothetical protein